MVRKKSNLSISETNEGEKRKWPANWLRISGIFLDFGIRITTFDVGQPPEERERTQARVEKLEMGLTCRQLSGTLLIFGIIPCEHEIKSSPRSVWPSNLHPTKEDGRRKLFDQQALRISDNGFFMVSFSYAKIAGCE